MVPETAGSGNDCPRRWLMPTRLITTCSEGVAQHDLQDRVARAKRPAQRPRDFRLAAAALAVMRRYLDDAQTSFYCFDQQFGRPAIRALAQLQLFKRGTARRLERR